MIKKNLPFLILYLIIHLTFFSIQLVNKNYYLSDSEEYLQVAENIIEHSTVYCGNLHDVIDVALYTKRPPGYPLLLASTMLFTNSMIPTLVLQMLLSLLSAYILIRIFGEERQRSYFFMFFILLFPSQFIYSNLIMSEILFQAIIMLLSWAIYTFINTNNNKYLWTYQAMLCVGILVKPVLYIFAFASLLFIVYLYFKHGKRLLLISGFIPLVFIIIFSGINQQKTGSFHVSSIQQTNIVDYNIRYFLMQKEGKVYAETVCDSINDHCSQSKTFDAYSKCLNSNAKNIIRGDLWSFGIYHMKGVFRFFIDPGRFDIYNFFGLQNSSDSYKGLSHHFFEGGIKSVISYLKDQPSAILLWILAITLINFIKLIGFAFFLFNKRIPLDFRIYLFIIIGTISFASGPLSAARFTVPTALLVLGAAAIQYQQWLSFLLTKRNF